MHTLLVSAQSECYAGLTAEQATETVTALMSIPVVTINSADFVIEGEEGESQILEEDIVTCAVNVVLKRPSHQKAGKHSIYSDSWRWMFMDITIG